MVRSPLPPIIWKPAWGERLLAVRVSRPPACSTPVFSSWRLAVVPPFTPSAPVASRVPASVKVLDTVRFRPPAYCSAPPASTVRVARFSVLEAPAAVAPLKVPLSSRLWAVRVTPAAACSWPLLTTLGALRVMPAADSNVPALVKSAVVASARSPLVVCTTPVLVRPARLRLALAP